MGPSGPSYPRRRSRTRDCSSWRANHESGNAGYAPSGITQRSDIISMRFIDRVGQRFGRLVVMRRGPPTPYGHIRWWCRCDCGNGTLVSRMNLTSGNTRSCGCLNRETASALHVRHGASRPGRVLPLYKIWAGMWKRCTKPTERCYPRYGGRGITVCDRWRDYALFATDMGDRPGPGYSLDRINNAEGYYPGNVRWATIYEQRHNSRNVRWLTANGVRTHLRGWAMRLQVSECR